MTPRFLGARTQPRSHDLRVATEPTLLSGIRLGQMDALLELYRRHGPLVYAAACRAGGAASAESVTRDVFLSLWAAPHDFTPNVESLRSLLVADAHVRAGGEASRAESEVDSSGHGSEVALLGSLPVAEAKALALLGFGGCTFREAAALSGEALPAVRRSAVRGARTLAASIRLGRS